MTEAKTRSRKFARKADPSKRSTRKQTADAATPETQTTPGHAAVPVDDQQASAPAADEKHGFAAEENASSAPATEPFAGAAPKTKSELILGLLRRDSGATLDEIVAATGWLPHTTRAALTGLKKKGHVVSSEKVDDVRRYRVAAAPAGEAE